MSGRESRSVRINFGRLQTARPVPRNAGPVDRLLQSAKGLVEIRPAAETATGSDPGSLMARVEDGVRRGAFGEALAEWERLPEASKSATAEWAGRVRARLAAETLAARLRTDALARIGAPG